MHIWWAVQISEKDVRIVKVLGRGASSVVSALDRSIPSKSRQTTLQPCKARRRIGLSVRLCVPQVYKAFLARCGKFVAIKKINCFERVCMHACLLSTSLTQAFCVAQLGRCTERRA